MAKLTDGQENTLAWLCGHIEQGWHFKRLASFMNSTGTVFDTPMTLQMEYQNCLDAHYAGTLQQYLDTTSYPVKDWKDIKLHG